MKLPENPNPKKEKASHSLPGLKWKQMLNTNGHGTFWVALKVLKLDYDDGCTAL